MTQERKETIEALKLKHFSPDTDPAIDWELCDLHSLKCLDNAREESGVPVIVTSNHRPPDSGIGFGTDAHTEIPTTAFDIRCKDAQNRWDSRKAFKLIPSLIKNGFYRIGICVKPGNFHIHVDQSVRLPGDVFFIEN